VVLAVAAFAALCVLALSVAQPFGVEPDDGAYRASIVAMTEGNFLTLSSAQITALAAKLGDGSGAPNQWVELSSGRYISEKDPGYPFLAAPFQALGVIRLAPLFYGALACLGLFIGARRWLGRFGGLAAVGLYCSSGAALLFAWRDYMPTFTDASLVAAGTGTLLWTLLATEATSRRRTWAGLAAFAAIELATFARYTDIVVLGCAVVTVVVARQLPAARLPLHTVPGSREPRSGDRPGRGLTEIFGASEPQFSISSPIVFVAYASSSGPYWIECQLKEAHGSKAHTGRRTKPRPPLPRAEASHGGIAVSAGAVTRFRCLESPLRQWLRAS
jgi:hypothetical protein